MSGGAYSLKSTPNDWFLRIFHVKFIYSQNACQKSSMRKTTMKYFVRFRIVGDAWAVIWTEDFTSNKPTLYLLNHGELFFLSAFDFYIYITRIIKGVILNEIQIIEHFQNAEELIRFYFIYFVPSFLKNY